MAQQQTTKDDIRILSVVWYKVLPAMFGGQKGVALFNEYLGRLATLTCLCSKNNAFVPSSYAIDASLPVGKSQFLNPFVWRKIYLAAKKGKATHLILEFPYYGLAGFLCTKLLSVKLIIHAHNIEAARFKEQKNRRWPLLALLEKWTLKQADAVFFKTQKDRQQARRTYGIREERTTVIPYGIVTGLQQPDRQQAKTIIYERHNIEAGTKLLLFAGTLDYGPNALAVQAMVQRIIPLLNKRMANYLILFCGRIELESFDYLKRFKNNRLCYAGNVSDVATYFAAADVFLNPVVNGGGVQTKIVDALSFGLNVVCFEEMTEGVAGAGNKIFAAPRKNWHAFTDAIMDALAYNEPTPAAFFEQHDWNRIAEKAYNLICTI